MADENTQSKFYVYYFSDPDGATKDARCHAIYTLIPFETLPWHVHKEAPDATVWQNGGVTNILSHWYNKACRLLEKEAVAC